MTSEERLCLAAQRALLAYIGPNFVRVSGSVSETMIKVQFVLWDDAPEDEIENCGAVGTEILALHPSDFDIVEYVEKIRNFDELAKVDALEETFFMIDNGDYARHWWKGR